MTIKALFKTVRFDLMRVVTVWNDKLKGFNLCLVL